MRKHRIALIAAFAMTFVLGLGMFLIGGAAAANPNGVAVSSAPAASSASVQTDLQARLDQLQNLTTQYQQREQQYQNQLKDVQTQLDDSQAQIAQYQQLVQFLVSRGILQVDNNGRLMLGNN